MLMLLFLLSHKAHGEQLPLIPKLTLSLFKSHHVFFLFSDSQKTPGCFGISSLLLSRKWLGPPQLWTVEYLPLLRQMNHQRLARSWFLWLRERTLPSSTVSCLVLFILSKNCLQLCPNSLSAPTWIAPVPSAFQHLYSLHSTSLFHNLLPIDMLRNHVRWW